MLTAQHLLAHRRRVLQATGERLGAVVDSWHFRLELRARVDGICSGLPWAQANRHCGWAAQRSSCRAVDWKGAGIYIAPTLCPGVCLNMASLVLFGCSHTDSSFHAFTLAAILMGLGNISFHLAQFHVSCLYPRSRGLVSSVFVAGFTGCGIMMYLLSLIFEAAGATRCHTPDRPAPCMRDKRAWPT